jgi:pilus assembly protein CpaE
VLDCVLISRDEDFRRHVSELIRRSEGLARLMLDLPNAADELPREALARILAAKPQIVFLDLGETITGVRVLKVLSQEAPEVASLVAGPTLEADTLLEIMRSGAAEYLPRPLGDDDLTTAFQRVRRRMASGRGGETAGESGRLLSVFSAKGGTGVTTVAVNLAVHLRGTTGKRVLLLDLAPALGTTALLLGIRPRYSYLDVIQNFHRIDDELLDSFLEDSEAGVTVLASPSVMHDALPPDPEQVMGLVRLCLRHFDYVVVDAGSTLSPVTEQVLHASNERLAVSTPELPTLRNLKRVLDLVGHSVNGHGPPKIVLNQYRDGTGVSRREVEEALGQPVYAMVEWDGDSVVQSLNLGRPAVSAAARSRFAKDLMRMGDRLTGGEAGAKPGKSGILPTFLNPFRSKTSR